jgi:hypothetical protein
MLQHLIEQIAILAMAGVLLGVPGAALVSLLRVRAALPDALAAPAAALLGSLVASLATAVQLTASEGPALAVGVHVVVSALLVGWALVVRRRRAARGDLVVPVQRGWDWVTSAFVAVGALFAWAERGAIALDGLYHVALSRKLLELAHPTFNNVNRFADGGPNPAYALPGWHALVGWAGWLTGSDPIVAWEIMPVLVVALGALAAGGLAKVLLERPVALPVGAFAWVLMRVLFARREVDGDAILYGAVPGQLTFELILPVLLAAIAIGLRTEERRVLRTSLAVAFACIAGIVIYHANYLPYVAIIGLGYAAWWLVDRANRAHDGSRLLVVGGAVAAMSVACMAVVLPLLAQLDIFGNAPEGDRIDYHLSATRGFAHVRGGHAFEMLGVAGMIAFVALPWLAWRVRTRSFGIVTGGVLALCAFSFLPPLFQLMRASGSLTLLLRINHPIGELLVVAFAALLIELADIALGWSKRRRRLAGGVVLLVLVGWGVVVGYEKFAPGPPGYYGWAALVIVFLVIAVRRGRRGGTRELAPASGRFIAATTLIIVLGLAMPVGAISIKRGLQNADDFVAADDGLAQGDLRCIGGPVFTALQQVKPGSVVLSDPVASFRAMAIAPVYVVGDYKVWNAATSDNRAEERLASINRFFDSSLSDQERLGSLYQHQADYLLVDLGDGRWLDADLGSTATKSLEHAWAGLDSFADVQAYDGGGIARLIRRNKKFFDEIAVDDRANEAAIPERNVDVDAPCNSYGLWKMQPAEVKFVERHAPGNEGER